MSRCSVCCDSRTKHRSLMRCLRTICRTMSGKPTTATIVLRAKSSDSERRHEKCLSYCDGPVTSRSNYGSRIVEPSSRDHQSKRSSSHGRARRGGYTSVFHGGLELDKPSNTLKLLNLSSRHDESLGGGP